MRSGTGGWTMGCNCDPGRPAPPICEVSGAGLPYRRFEPKPDVVILPWQLTIFSRLTRLCSRRAPSSLP